MKLNERKNYLKIIIFHNLFFLIFFNPLLNTDIIMYNKIYKYIGNLPTINYIPSYIIEKLFTFKLVNYKAINDSIYILKHDLNNASGLNKSTISLIKSTIFLNASIVIYIKVYVDYSSCFATDFYFVLPKDNSPLWIRDRSPGPV